MVWVVRSISWLNLFLKLFSSKSLKVNKIIADIAFLTFRKFSFITTSYSKDWWKAEFMYLFTQIYYRDNICDKI
jgi:hypothetical protein